MDDRVAPTTDADQFQRWFLGLEQKSERRLCDAEIADLRRRLSRLRARPILVVGAMALLVCPLILIFSSQSQSEIPDALVFVYAISLVFIGLPLVILLIRDGLREAGILKGDLRIGCVFTFEGPVGEPWRSCRAIKGLVKERLISIEEGARPRLDVLPVSGAVIVANGLKPEGWWKGDVVEATAPPEQHYDVPVSLNNPAGLAGERFDVLQRHLSPGEIAELRYHITRIRRPPGMLIVMTVWMAILLTAMLMYASEGKLGQWLDRFKAQAPLVSGIFAVNAYRYIRTARTARLMNLDVSREVLRIYKPDVGAEGEIKEERPPSFEVLPASLLVWTVEGKPYPWRLRKSRHPKS